MGQAFPGSFCAGRGALGEFEWPPDGAAPGLAQDSHASHSSAASLRRHCDRWEYSSGPDARRPAEDEEEEALSPHRRRRERSRTTHEFLSKALRQSRLCAMLDDSDIDSLINSLEYHVYHAGEVVAAAGVVGGPFFVSGSEGLELVLCGGAMGKVPHGRTFGESSLLQRCPRSVSVVATQADVGVWAADGRLFRRAVQVSAMLRSFEHRAFLGSVAALQGLTTRQLDLVSDAATLHRVRVGERPARLGREAAHVLVLKSGRFRVVEEEPRREGCAEELGPGDCVCERALLYGEAFSMTVEALAPSEVLRIDMRRLRRALRGEICPIRLQQAFLRRCLERSGLFSGWPSQVAQAAQFMELREYAPHAEVRDVAGAVIVVIDGSLNLGASAAALKRGSCQRPPAPAPDEGAGALRRNGPAAARRPQQPVPVAGAGGCRLGVLPPDVSLGGGGSSSSEEPERTMARMARVLSKVCVFRHLPRQQLDILVSGVVRRHYRRGDTVFLQGDRGSDFFVVVEGEALVRVSGRVVRRLPRYAYFGERAILFGEPRAATIEVSSEEGAEIWALDKGTFQRVVTEKSLSIEQLKARVWLQDPGVELRDLKKLGVIGRGTSGVVHLVKHTSGFAYALKCVKKADNTVPRQVRREIEVLSENDHPFIMHLVKTMETPECVYLLMEYISGGELHAAIRTISTVLSRSQAMFYTGSMLLMLESLSDNNVVYRDLKPENVVLDAQGYLKLIDFGSAKKLESSCLRTFTRVGTPHYMAPEVLRGKGYGTEVDIWALGVALYELVCGFLPFGDSCENVGDVCKAVLAGDLQFPPELEEVTRDLIVGLLSPKPHSRLGCDARGYKEIKRAPFFSFEGLLVDGLAPREGSVDFFELLLCRDLQAPIRPAEHAFPAAEADAGGVLLDGQDT